MQSQRFASRSVFVLLVLATAACAPALNDARAVPRARVGELPSRASAPTPRKPMTLSLSAYVAREFSDVLAHVQVAPDPRSRRLVLEWWSSAGAGGSHTIDVDGDRASSNYRYAMRQMAAGEYRVTATVIRADGSRVARTVQLIVAGHGHPVQTGVDGWSSDRW